MFGNSWMILFLLVFLIICILVTMWLKKRERLQKEREPKKPIYSSPDTSQGEGFQTSSGSGSGSRSNSRYLDTYSGSAYRGSYRSQLDNPTGNKYGVWAKTSFDKYYDKYEENELIAMSNMAAKLKDLTPETPKIPEYGSTLGYFDSQTNQIPWDADNSSYNQSDIVWGTVSEQASRSIFLKKWLRELLANSDQMQPCGENAANYCYHSPQFAVTVSDPIQGYSLKVAENLSQAIGSVIQMKGFELIAGGQLANTRQEAVLDADGTPLKDANGKAVMRNIENTFANRMEQNRGSINRFFGIKPSVPLETLPTKSVTAGPHLGFAGGIRKLLSLSKKLIANVKAKLSSKLKATQAAAFSNGRNMVITANATAAALTATTAGLAAGGVTAPAAVATGFLAAAATAIAVFVNFFFGLFQIILMCVEAIITPIITTLFHPGGECPPGSRRFSSLIPDYAMTFISNFIPMGSFLQLFDPYICWSPDGRVHLMTPPKIPPFMADATLSVRFHPDWVAGEGPNIPKPRNLSIIMDPLPPNYVWLNQSDLATSPNANAIATYAATVITPYASSGSASSGSASSGSSTNGLPIAVELCAAGTSPSNDGHTCVSIRRNTDVIGPLMTACPANNTDDGFNCWRTVVGNCTGGTVGITSGTSWDDNMGYLNVSISPLVCDGVAVTPNSDYPGISVWYNQRITCPAGYEKEIGGLVCYAVCPPNFKRIGSVCQSTTSTYARGYMLGTTTSYYDQPYKPREMNTKDDIDIPYCDFSKPVMLDKMAQFYYNNSINNPVKNEDGTITIQMITGFSGVISSSELSCDVVCHIMFVTYDPITGGNLTTSMGCKKDYEEAEDLDFQGCPFCYRRFYFIRGPSDPQGEFTVTGCTFASYTSPDSMVATSNIEENIIPSIPKVWDEHSKDASIVDLSNLLNNLKSVATQAAIGLTDVAVMTAVSEISGRLGGRVGARTGAVANLAGGAAAGMFSSMWLNDKLTQLSQSAINTSDIQNTINTFVTGSAQNGYGVVSNNNWWTVYQGPVYEQAQGYTPQIKFCEKRIIGNDHCTHKYVIRDMVDKYHNQYKYKHIKEITEIEARGKSGCYYKFQEVDYNPDTNFEEAIEMDNEIILEHTISDYLSCTYTPTSFSTNISNYPVRSYADPLTFTLPTPKIIYPTRNTYYTSDLIARFVRVRPPLVPATSGSLRGDGFLNLAQIAVFDTSGFNISTFQPTYATSTMSSASDSDSVVNGTTTPATTLVAVWECATNGLTEYWEVDLGKNMNISEVVYFGATIVPGRNQGVRIEFLYSNAADEIPIFTYTLPTDDTVQYIPLYSSSYSKPIYPLAGSIPIPRPFGQKNFFLGEEQGCVNRCENKNIIDSVISQYNTQASAQGSEQKIVKILRGMTVNTNTCEYLAQMLVQDTPTTDSMGSQVTGKRSMARQYISTSLTPTIQGYSGLVFARYVKIIPSFKEGTVLEISKILVWNSVPVPGTQDKQPGKVVSQGMGASGNITSFNELYQLDQIYETKRQTNPRLGQFDFITDGTATAKVWPDIYVARSNDRSTNLTIDLGTNDMDPCPGVSGKNYEIYQIQFVGALDRDPGGIQGIRIELYADAPGESVDVATGGKYAPTFAYNLPTDDTTQMVKVSAPAKCSFTLQGTDILEKPRFLLSDIPDFSTTDTSGGVFFFSGMVESIRNAWEAITKLTTTDMVAPIMNNVAVSNQIVGSMLDTVSASQKMSGTNNTCKDPEVLRGFMTAYALSRGPSHTDQFGVITYLMNRILKAGPSSPTTCDVLFEDMYAMYEDYIVDVKDKDSKGTEIKAVRFKMDNVNGNAIPAQDAPGSTTSVNIVDLSANAIGLLSSSSTLSPVFNGPGYMANCTDPAVLRTIKQRFESAPITTATGTTSLTANSVTQTFQSTPLSCEYALVKTKNTVNRINNTRTTWSNINTYVKAVFNLGTDGRTVTLKSLTEYDPALITYSSDYMRTYINGVEVYLPSLVSYQPAKYGVSTRVNTTVYNM